MSKRPIFACGSLEPRLLLAGDVAHSLTHLPAGHQVTSAVTVGNRAVFIGTLSRGRHRSTAIADVYDADTGQWSTFRLPEAPTSTRTPSVVNGRVVLLTTPTQLDRAPLHFTTLDPATGQATVSGGLPEDPTGTTFVPMSGTTAVVGSKLVNAGGVGPTVPFFRPGNQTVVFDADTQDLSTAHQLHDRAFPYAATVGHKAVFVDRTEFVFEQSGFFGSDVAEVYDADTDQWSSTTLPAAHTSLAVASVDDVALFAGGRAQHPAGDLLPGTSAAVDLFHAATNTFTTTMLSVPREDIAAGAVGHYALFAGGTYFRNYAGRTYTESTVDLYDARTDQWSTASLSTPRADARVAVAGDVALVYGGASGRPGARVDVFNAQSDTWSATTMPIQFLGSSAVTVGRDVIFYAQGNSLLEIYDTATGTWTTSQLSAARTDLTVTSVGNTALFAGGVSGGRLSDVVDVFAAPAAAASPQARPKPNLFSTAGSPDQPVWG